MIYCPSAVFVRRTSIDGSSPRRTCPTLGPTNSESMFPDQREVFSERVRLAQEWAGFGQFNTATSVASLYR